MFSEAVDDGDNPFLAVDCLVELLGDDMIVLEGFADAHELAFVGVDTRPVCFLFGFNAVQGEGVDDHIPGHSVAEIVGTGVVIVLHLVLPEYLSVFFLILLGVV